MHDINHIKNTPTAHYHNNTLFLENVSIIELVKQYGTPCYIYSKAAITQNYAAFNTLAHPHRIAYAVKANANLGILNVLARLGAGFDIVSRGELARVLQAGGRAEQSVFSGVGKTTEEIEYALQSNIFCLNIESQAELERTEKIAKYLNKQAPIALRVNPNVDAKTHPYISTGLKENKFGIEPRVALELYKHAQRAPHLKIQGLACHIGSQITQISPFIEAISRLKALINTLIDNNISISHLNIGGGLGIDYGNFTQTVPSIKEYIQAVHNAVQSLPLEIILEPGRAIMGPAGILVTKLEYIKKTPFKHFAIVDAGMNDLCRPVLYDAWQSIVGVELKNVPIHCYDIVGPLCETGDFLAKERSLAIEQGDYLAVENAGAYGFSMSSNYNSRPRVAEILVDKHQHYLVRQRENWQNLSDLESILPL